MPSLRTVTDATGRTVEIADLPRRIVSLVPSTTETLYDLGVWDRVAGCTGWCNRPAHAVKGMRRVGGVKRDMNYRRLREIAPDLVLANAEEQSAEDLERLCAEFPTWVSIPRTVREAVEFIRSLGDLVGAAEKGGEIAAAIEQQVAAASARAAGRPAVRVLYPIWRAPHMTIGRDTFIHDMLRLCGGRNVYADAAKRYPEFTLDDAAGRRVALVLLPDEPFRFRDEHAAEFDPLGAPVRLVSGDNVCWYGSRMREGIAYLAEQIACGA